MKTATDITTITPKEESEYDRMIREKQEARLEGCCDGSWQSRHDYTPRLAPQETSDTNKKNNAPMDITPEKIAELSALATILIVVLVLAFSGGHFAHLAPEVSTRYNPHRQIKSLDPFYGTKQTKRHFALA